MPLGKDILTAAVDMADRAAEVVRHYYESTFDIESKADKSPIVTVADRRAEEVIRAHIEKHFPHHGIIGEEFGEKKTNSEYIWVLDPIDGTIAFSVGKPIFGTLIALLKNDRPVLGIVDQPILKKRWIGGEGHPTTLNGVPCRTRGGATLSQAAFSTTNPVRFGAYQPLLDALLPRVRFASYGGDCFNYGLVASGKLDIIIEVGLDLFDFAALAPVVENAGGVVTDLNGAPLTRLSVGNLVAAANADLHRQVLALAREQ